MTRTEAQLRAALHDGEGDGVDPDTVLWVVRAQRRQRRARVKTAAATVVVAAALSGAGYALSRASDGSEQASSSVKRAPAYSNTGSGAVAGAAASSAASAASPSAFSSAAGGVSSGAAAGGNAPTSLVRPDASSAVRGTPASGSVNSGSSCPAEPPVVAAGNSASALFARPVVSATLCTYPDFDRRARPGAATLDRDAARILAASLEAAQRTRPSGNCPDLVNRAQRTLVVLARDSSGRALPPVRTTLDAPACRVVVTNGHASRFGWSPPADLSAVLRRIS